MNITNTEKLLSELKQSLDLTIIIELCKSGATRDQIREVLGSLDNNKFSKIKAILKLKK